MALLKVNPTRINLLGLKKDLKVAERGHKLLKDKRDGLMRKFMDVIHETKTVRMEVNAQMKIALTTYVRAASPIAPKIIDTAFMAPDVRTTVSIRTKEIMSVKIPSFETHIEGRAFSYGFLETGGDLDKAVQMLRDLFPKMIRLAELEKTVENLALEIEKTRRRTSVLEHVMIPNMRETVRHIYFRLEEQARDAIVGTMRIKAMITQKEI